MRMRFIRDAAALVMLAALLTACGGGERKRSVVYVEEEDFDAEVGDYARSGDEVVIPFREEGGVKYVSVTVNGMDVEMIFDTGCSSTLISMAEANYLYQKGLLEEGDILGTAHAVIADGSIVENAVVNLREVVIGGQVMCSDVTATVSENPAAPLLLGNEVLDRVATLEIDNERKALIFKLK